MESILDNLNKNFDGMLLQLQDCDLNFCEVVSRDLFSKFQN